MNSTLLLLSKSRSPLSVCHGFLIYGCDSIPIEFGAIFSKISIDSNRE